MTHFFELNGCRVPCLIERECDTFTDVQTEKYGRVTLLKPEIPQLLEDEMSQEKPFLTATSNQTLTVASSNLSQYPLPTGDETPPDHLQVVTPMAQVLNGTAPKEYRNGCGVRLDLLDGDFLQAMGKIMHLGAQKYGEGNWLKGLSGQNSGINHAMKHCAEYINDEPCDYGEHEMHMAQVAVNAMFEYHHAKKARLAKGKIK